MNNKLFIPGLIILLVGILFSLITPAIWCYFGTSSNKFTCCFPIVLNSILVIIGICLLVLALN